MFPESKILPLWRDCDELGNSSIHEYYAEYSFNLVITV